MTRSTQEHGRHPAATDRGGSRARARAGVGALAVVVAVALWALARGLDIEVRAPAMGGAPPAAIPLLHVIASSAVASLVAWAVLATLERTAARARLIWVALAGIGLVVSLMPVTGEGITAANRVVLVVLHLAVAAVLVVGLPRAPSRNASATEQRTTGAPEVAR